MMVTQQLRNRILLLAFCLMSSSLVMVSTAFMNSHYQTTNYNNIGRHCRIRILAEQTQTTLLAVSTQNDAESAARTPTTRTDHNNDNDNKIPANTSQQRPQKQVNDNNNNGQQQQQPPQKKREPWTACFHVSKKTQHKIQQAAQDARGTRRTPMERATAVLQTLLSMPFERCNPANLVCALTLSAKVMGQGYATKNNGMDKFRSLLFEVLDILHELVIHKKALNSRQLCNSIWAVAKHYDRDPLLLPLSPQMAAVSSDQFVVAETWDLNDGGGSEEDLSPSERVDATVQALARQLTDVLTKEAQLLAQDANEKNSDNNAENGGVNRKPSRRGETKLGEICMASWAFGILRPRRRPPGWLAPPQMGKLPQFNSKADDPKRSRDFITFEQWTTNGDGNDLSFINPTAVDAEPEDAADALFDAIGEALCRPLEANAFTNPSMYDPPFDLMRITDCTWSEIANVAWAFEKRARCQSKESEMLLRSLSREASRRLWEGGRETRHMLSRDISQLTWALGALQQDNFRLAHDLVDLVDNFSEHLSLDSNHENSRPFETWSCPDIVQMSLPLAHARIDESGLLLALFEEAKLRLANGISTESRFKSGRKTFLAWEVSAMLWAQARLFLTASEGDVYEDFTQTVTKCIQSHNNGGRLSDIGIGPQEQANIAWALTVLEQHQSEESIDLLRGVFRDAATACEEDGLIQLEHAHQLWQALFLLEEESPSAASQVPKWFRDYLSEKWNLEKSRKKLSSARHKSISQVLNLMGVAHYNEHDEDIDVAIVLKEQASWAHQTVIGESSTAMRVAVEFDGPNHFTRKRAPRDDQPAVHVRALGHTVLKYRLLKKTGWTVIRVPYYEFDKIPFWASMERQRYLQRLLKTHANIKFSDVDISEYSSPSANRKTRFD